MADDKKKETAHQEKIRQCYEDGSAEINGRSYKFCKVTHKQRLKIFGYLNKIKHRLSAGDLSFFGDDDFDKIENLMFSNMTYNDSSLAKIDNHFEKYGEDYINLIAISLSVFSHPFMKGSR